ncbi:MAG: CNP1-like family protein [Betaproteobacteria bacterium]
MKLANWMLAAVLLLVAPHVLAFKDPTMPVSRFEEDFDEKPWSEVEVQLPAFPEKENLIAFKVGAVVESLFFIDGKSIVIGSDGVIRYVLVVVSSQGAQNISYEGMRCDTLERRFYASGRSDKTWSKARNNQWVRIQGTSNNHHVELFNNNFCPNKIISPSAEEARRVLRQGGISR